MNYADRARFHLRVSPYDTDTCLEYTHFNSKGPSFQGNELVRPEAGLVPDCKRSPNCTLHVMGN